MCVDAKLLFLYHEMTLLLLSGNAEAGKSTMAKYLINKYDNYVEYALSDKLKQLTFELLKLFNVSINSIDDLYDVETKKNYRKYLQLIGTECCRKVFGDDFWCIMLNKDIKKSIAEGKNVIISDVRFLNEHSYFKQKYEKSINVVSIMIKRTDANSLTSEQKLHSSESEINNLKYDYEINNNLTEEFYSDIDKVIECIFKEKHENVTLNSSVEAEPEVHSEVEVKPDVEIEVEHETKDETIVENNEVKTNEVETKVEPESKVETNEVEVKSEHETEDNTKVENEFHSEVEPKINIETETKTESDHEVEPDHEVDIKDKPEHEPEVEIKDKLKIEHNEETETEIKDDNESNVTQIYPNQYSSYNLGRIGEQAVLAIIEKVRPAFDSNLVSATGHVADIHSIDYKNNIKYVFEIKYKLKITKEDVNKFVRDIENIQKSESLQYRVIGFFISLNSDVIPSIGNLSISRDKIYITRNYFSENMLNLIFQFVETYISIYNEIPESNTTHVKYELSSNVLELLVKLRSEYASLTKEMELYTQMKINTEQNLNSIYELMSKVTLKEQFIKFINNEFSDVLPEIKEDISSNEEDKLREYIQSHGKWTIKKRDLIKLFPSMMTKLSSMTLNDILAEYKQ